MELNKLSLIHSGKCIVRVFIVDDSELVRSRLVQALSEIKGIKIVGEAGFVEDAIREIMKLTPDIAIIDIKMTDGNGIDILTAIRKNNLATRFIVLTNYPYLQYRKRYLDAGADFFFYKATEMNKLEDLLEKIVLRQKKELMVSKSNRNRRNHLV